jgi:biopolymer transport protein ExbB
MTLTLIIADAIVNDRPAPEMSFFELLMKGGVVIIPIILLSLISVYIFAEKLFFIRNTARLEKGFAEKIAAELVKGSTEGALNICRNAKTAFGRIFENGVSFYGKPVKEMENIMESTANVEIARMEKNIGYLGIIAGIAPMLGFIGTISGVIKIFYNISLTDNISISIIAGGLYQKMVSSGTGLIVGVFAYSFYHYLQIRIDKFSQKLQEETLTLTKIIQK